MKLVLTESIFPDYFLITGELICDSKERESSAIIKKYFDGIGSVDTYRLSKLLDKPYVPLSRFNINEKDCKNNFTAYGYFIPFKRDLSDSDDLNDELFEYKVLNEITKKLSNIFKKDIKISIIYYSLGYFHLNDILEKYS